MIDNNAFDLEEAVTLMQTIVSLIHDLQSPARQAEYSVWFQAFVVRCRASGSLDNVLKLLPSFFEVATMRIEELQIEVCVYTTEPRACIKMI